MITACNLLHLQVLVPGFVRECRRVGPSVRVFCEESLEFVLRVEYLHVEGAARHVFSRPLDMQDVVTDLCGVIATQNGAIALTLSLHLHTEGTCGQR